MLVTLPCDGPALFEGGRGPVTRVGGCRSGCVPDLDGQVLAASLAR